MSNGQIELMEDTYVSIREEASEHCNHGDRRAPGISLQVICKLDSLSSPEASKPRGAEGITHSQTKTTQQVLNYKVWRDWGCDIHREEKEKCVQLQETNTFPFLGPPPPGGSLPILSADSSSWSTLVPRVSHLEMSYQAYPELCSPEFYSR